MRRRPDEPADDGALVVRECEAPCYRSESGRPRGADDGEDEQGVRIGDGAREHERRQSCDDTLRPPGTDPRSADLAERHAAPPREERQHEDRAERLDDERGEGGRPDLADGEEEHDRERSG